MGKTVAVGLLSGGLDSTLAARILIDQEVEVHAINFVSPFCTCTPKSFGCAAVVRAVEQLGNIPLKRVSLGDSYLQMVKTPKHGYGRGINPCIDCRILKIKRALEYMREIGASFLFTGEVLGQRPMSQHREALDIIDRDSGAAGLIVRPLSASLLPPTIPETTGLIDREKLLAFRGRSRKPQIALADQKGIGDYPCPAGGCLLTDPHFAGRLRHYFDRNPNPSTRDIALLKTGRHFRMQDGGSAIVSRDEHEGAALLSLARDRFTVFIPGNFSGPVVVLDGGDRDGAKKLLLQHSKFDGVNNPAINELVPSPASS